MSNAIRRLFLIILSPIIFVGFSIAALVWWLMEGELDIHLVWEAFVRAWSKP